MSILSHKHILVGVTGSIAAYKSAELIRDLRELGATVRVVMTKSAQEFITPLTMQALSGNPVHLDLLDPNSEAAMGHIELARWADLILIAPASANIIARIAYGFADELLTTLCLATTKPIFLVPAMNQQMWLNNVTQENIEKLQKRNIKIIGPAIGLQACGDIGPGRMLELKQIIDVLENNLIKPILKNKKIVVTAGPTQEPIDPVRYLSNHSSGKMGFALAEAAATLGAEVTLVSGPCSLPTPTHINRINVGTAEEMLKSVLDHINGCDVFIAAAAVADYRCEVISQNKIKKSQSEIKLNLIRNPDILATVSQLPNKPYIVGFAAETENIINNAEKKLKNKNIDMIIANQVGQSDLGFNSDYNQATAIWSDGKQEFPYATKQMLAKNIMRLIESNIVATSHDCNIQTLY